jgi:hypothetical protein
MHGPVTRPILVQLKEQQAVTLSPWPKQLLVFKGLFRLSHLSRSQFFVYQYHIALGTHRQMEGENSL